MAIPVTRERIDYGSPDGSVLFGVARQVIDPAGAARTLLVGESGALCVFSTAAGQAYTLPAIAALDVGTWYEFLATLDGTGTYSVTTDAATTFLVGGVDSMSDAFAEGGGFYEADGTGHLNITMDSDVTGRMVGTHLRFTALSATQWALSGILSTEGTTATPF